MAARGAAAEADCADCQGTGWAVRTVDGARRAERCDCWRVGVAGRMLARARIPARYAKCGFSTFVTYDNEKLERAFRKAREFAGAFPVVDKGLLFIGPCGVGKTHLAVSVLREALAKGMRGVYYDTRSLLSAIRSTYNPVTRASEADVLGEVMRAELLVLDDLGAERLTDWVEETMHLIVNTRYNEQRPTVFTTNYEAKEPATATNYEAKEPATAESRHFGPGPGPTGENAALIERIGGRLFSRLREMCEFLEYDGPDYREFEHPPTAENLHQKWKMGARRGSPKRTSARTRVRPPGGEPALGWSGGRAGT